MPKDLESFIVKLALPQFYLSSPRAWANPSPRLHQARLQMDNGTKPPQPRNSYLSWK